MTELPMPPVRDYFVLPLVGRYYHYVYNTMDVPARRTEQHPTLGEVEVFTPTFDNLKVYGRVVGSPYAEDQEGLKRLFDAKRVWGQWFSEVEPEGEIGSMALEDVNEISAEEFSAAYLKEWK